MIHLKTAEFIDFGNIENLLVDFTIGDLLVIKGANGAGKSTAILGIWQILRQKFPSKPVKDGKKKGSLVMQLEDGTKIEYIAIRQDGDSFLESLTVTNPSGRALGKAEQTNYLRQLIGGTGSGFDVGDFLRALGTKPAREMLAKLSLQCGADLEAIERAKMKYDGLFKDRTEASQKLTAQKARAVPYDAELAAKSPVDAAELSAKKSEIQAHNVKFTNSETVKAGIESQLANCQKTRQVSRQIFRHSKQNIAQMTLLSKRNIRPNWNALKPNLTMIPSASRPNLKTITSD